MVNNSLNTLNADIIWIAQALIIGASLEANLSYCFFLDGIR